MFELDRAMKILAARYPHIFQWLLFGDNPDIVFEKVEDSAINIAEHRSDKIFCFRENDEQKLVTYEFVTQPKKSDLLRFHAKNGLLTASYLIEVVTVIVYLERGPYRTFPYEYIAQIGNAITKTQFSRILLWEYSEQVRSGNLRELAPLLVLFEEKPTSDTVLKEKELIKGISNKREQSDLLALATMIAFRKFKDTIIKELFYEEFDMLKESSFVKDWLQESWEKGISAGRKKGLAEGRKEGRKEGLRKGQIKIIMRLLERILGRISSDLESKILSLNDIELERLSYDLLGMREATDLEKWFQAREENDKN